MVQQWVNKFVSRSDQQAVIVMGPLLEAYRAGQCQQVRDWIALSPERCDGQELLLIADELVQRSIENVQRIYEALVAIGYRFARPDAAWVLRKQPSDEPVKAFESRLGAMPLVAQRWYARVHAMNFGQCEKQFFDRSSPLSALGWHASLVVQSLDDAVTGWEEYVRGCEQDNQHRSKYGYELSPPPTPVLFLGGCASNNDSKGFELPSHAFDGVLYNDGAGDVRFGAELASAFRCFGFPILSANESTRKVVRTIVGEPDYAFIKQNLPINLLPV